MQQVRCNQMSAWKNIHFTFVEMLAEKKNYIFFDEKERSEDVTLSDKQRRYDQI